MKFRVWDFKHKKFLFSPEDGIFLDGNGKLYIGDIFPEPADEKRYEINQFICISDLDQKPIYENDIIINSVKQHYIVKVKNIYCITLQNRTNEFLSSYSLISSSSKTVGNIYQNKIKDFESQKKSDDLQNTQNGQITIFGTPITNLNPVGTGAQYDYPLTTATAGDVLRFNGKDISWDIEE